MTTWMRQNQKTVELLDPPARIRSATVRVQGAMVLLKAARRIIATGHGLPSVEMRLAHIEAEVGALEHFLTTLTP